MGSTLRKPAAIHVSFSNHTAHIVVTSHNVTSVCEGVIRAARDTKQVLKGVAPRGFQSSVRFEDDVDGVMTVHIDCRKSTLRQQCRSALTIVCGRNPAYKRLLTRCLNELDCI